MSLISILIGVLIIIAILWAIQRFVTDGDARKILTLVVAIGGAILILYWFGVFGKIAQIHT